MTRTTTRSWVDRSVDLGTLGVVRIVYGDRDTYVMERSTGLIVYSTPTTRRALVRAISWVTTHCLTLLDVRREEESHL
jgi:hypothetical protein